MKIQAINNNQYSNKPRFGAKLRILKDMVDMNVLQKEGRLKRAFQPYTNDAIRRINSELECTAKALGKDSDVLEVKIHNNKREDNEIYYGQDNFYFSWSDFKAKYSATLKSDDKEVCSVSHELNLPHIYSEPELHEMDEADGISMCVKNLRDKYFEDMQKAKIERKKEAKKLRRIELDKIKKQREAEIKELKMKQRESQKTN